MLNQLISVFTWIVIGFALILIVEGLIYTLFPNAMKGLLTRMLDVPRGSMQMGGLAAVITGIVILEVIGLSVLPI